MAKFCLILSAMAPIALVYAWVAWNEGRSSLASLLLGCCIVLVLLCIYLLKRAEALLERFPFRVNSVEAADRENIAFMLLYLSPLFTAQFGELNWTILAPTLFVFALLISTGYNYHFNPLLGLAGWHFYKVSSAEGVTYVLITKKQLRSTNEIASVGQLTEYILIDLERERAR